VTYNINFNIETQQAINNESYSTIYIKSS